MVQLVPIHSLTGPRSLYSFGDEITSTSNDREKFATYTRDAYTGLDYAMNRYYASTYGRFNTADPSWKSVSGEDPSSWNRYSYASGDPVGSNDPNGLCAVMLSGITMGPGTNWAWGQEAASLQADTAYPYAGLGPIASISSVKSQATSPNASTWAAYEAIGQAIASNAGPVDIIAYSGGAGAFTAAYQLLTNWQKSRIGEILYIAPGAATQLASNGNTSVLMGPGAGNYWATIKTSLPPGAQVTNTYCSHTDLGCFFKAAATQISQIKLDGACNSPDVYTNSNPFVGVPGVGAPGVGIPSAGSGWTGGGYPSTGFSWVIVPDEIVTSTISYQ